MKVFAMLLSVTFLFASCNGCRQSIGDLGSLEPILESYENGLTTARVGGSVSAKNIDEKFTLSVPEGDFINTITVFAFYDRYPSGHNGYHIMYCLFPFDSSSLSTSDLYAPFPTEGIKIDASVCLVVRVFHDDECIGERVMHYKKVPESRVPFSPMSGVMLQGFTWDSCRQSEDVWYDTISKNAKEIKDTFNLVWFPPPSTTPEFAMEGYGPTMLNNLNSAYGTFNQLHSAIASLSPLPVIADVVVNHRGGTTDWADFTDPQWTPDYLSICGNDSFFFDNELGKQHKEMGGAQRLSYEMFPAFRNLDHTNDAVRAGIVSWLNSVLFRAGFSGWRFDFVKGYPASATAQYAVDSCAVFSVGEYWPSAGFSSVTPAEWTRPILDWQTAASTDSCPVYVFDFVLKGFLNAIGSKASGVRTLASDQCLFRQGEKHAVTFVENHDTAKKENGWPLNLEFIGPAYAFVLISPGYPCVFWDHYFGSLSKQMIAGTGLILKEHIKRLIEIRKLAGITGSSTEEILYVSDSVYVVRIVGENLNIILKVGTTDETQLNTLYKEHRREYDVMYDSYPTYTGSQFAIWTYPLDCNLSVGDAFDKNLTAIQRLVCPLHSGWNDVFVHCWRFDEELKIFTDITSWPGMKMSFDPCSKYFFCDVPNFCTNAVFTDGYGNQTTDMSIVECLASVMP